MRQEGESTFTTDYVKHIFSKTYSYYKAFGLTALQYQLDGFSAVQ